MIIIHLNTTQAACLYMHIHNYVKNTSKAMTWIFPFNTCYLRLNIMIYPIWTCSIVVRQHWQTTEVSIVCYAFRFHFVSIFWLFEVIVFYLRCVIHFFNFHSACVDTKTRGSIRGYIIYLESILRIITRDDHCFHFMTSCGKLTYLVYITLRPDLFRSNTEGETLLFLHNFLPLYLHTLFCN